ncbi:MAG: type II toxin-antitoxin system RelE/ParE family toxin [Deltaproteobacteria bacterium]|nr:type II toxin-antitoxin system RelE/ParE family toxin [Deltaproteobacteria bacterium]
MSRSVRWEQPAVKDTERHGTAVCRRIVEAVERFAAIGHGSVERLKGQDGYRLRVGDWRVLFRMDSKTITVVRVLPRGGAYRD